METNIAQPIKNNNKRHFARIIALCLYRPCDALAREFTYVGDGVQVEVLVLEPVPPISFAACVELIEHKLPDDIRGLVSVTRCDARLDNSYVQIRYLGGLRMARD